MVDEQWSSSYQKEPKTMSKHSKTIKTSETSTAPAAEEQNVLTEQSATVEQPQKNLVDQAIEQIQAGGDTPAVDQLIAQTQAKTDNQPAPETAVEKATRILGSASTKSYKIRALYAMGYSKGQIAKFMGIRYQHVRNVLIVPVKNPKLS